MNVKAFFNKKNKQLSVNIPKKELYKFKTVKQNLRYGKIPKNIKLNLKEEDIEF